MTFTVAMYLAYLLIAVPLTLGVARTLQRNGKAFLVDVFVGKEDLAVAVNKLLVVAFYLVTIGFVTVVLPAGAKVADLQALIEALSVKLGLVMLALGVLHLFNVALFNGFRRRHLESLRPRPLLQPAYAPVPAPAAAGPGTER